jgi:hypothetical protein
MKRERENARLEQYSVITTLTCLIHEERERENAKLERSLARNAAGAGSGGPLPQLVLWVTFHLGNFS